MPLAPATRLGRYEVRSLLGVGGMGEVYLAEDTQLHRMVAVKVLPDEFVDSADRLERFEREAFAASSLNHPNILTIHEIGQSDGRYFIATEHIDGESLRDRMANGPLDMHELLEIGVQTASALAAAHAAGIVHRDIKPENIMVRQDGIVKVLDFGLAKLAEKKQQQVQAGSDAPTRHNTAPGIVLGTASYMSPEQARGKDVDTRTDIWSLGVVLYEMAAGTLPFKGETITDTLGLIMHKEPPRLTGFNAHIPSELDRIVTKALAKDKDDRYQVVKDLGIDLKSLKRELEFDAVRERTASPNHTTDERYPQTAAISARFSDSQIHSTSSAEYIATGIMRHKSSFAAAGLFLVAALAGLGYFYFGSKAEASINSVAVLPFVNVAGDTNAEYISDGLSEGIINNLSQLSQLKIISRSSAFKYKGKEIDIDEVAKALGVGAVVMGRVLQRGDDLQISVEMVNAADKSQIYGEQFTRKASDLQAVESQISREIAERLRLRLTGAQEQQMAKVPTQNPEAFQLYLNGEFLRRKGGIENNRKALDNYTQAAALDPNFALAYVGIAASYQNFAGMSAMDPKDVAAKSRAAIERALAIDDKLAYAHATLAGIQRNEWDWQGAESGYKRAIELNPNLFVAHSNYAAFLSMVGRSAEALTEMKRAQELEPLLPNLKANEALILYLARRSDEAIQILQNQLKLQPDDTTFLPYLGYAYMAKGQYAEAITAFQRSISIEETTSDHCFLAAAFARSGRRDEALAVLDKLKTTKEYVSPAELAVAYTALGDKETAFRLLERAYADRDPQMQFLKVEPNYDDLRSDPRFADLLRRVGIPD